MKSEFDACACMNLRKTTRLIAQFYDKRLQPSGLRTTQFSLLASLANLQPISIAVLAEQMGMDRTTLTRNIKLLERQSLVESRPGKDARVRLLSLTKKGQAAIEQTRPHWQRAQSEFLGKFGPQRWQNLHAELNAASEVLIL